MADDQNRYRPRPASSAVAAALNREVNDRRSSYQERDDTMHQMRKLRLMRHRPFVPKTYQARLGGARAIKLPIIMRMIQTAVTASTKNDPAVYVEAFDAEDRSTADQLAQGADLLLQTIDNQGPLSFNFDLAFKMMGDGLGVAKVQDGSWLGYPLKEAGEDKKAYNRRVEEFRAQQPVPFRVNTVDPLTCYPPLDQYGEGAFIETSWRSTREVMQSLSLEQDTAGGLRAIPQGRGFSDLEFPLNMPPMSKVTEIWTKNECGILIDGYEEVLIFDNPLGQLPYSYGFADPTGVDDPTNMGMSVAFPLFYVAPWIDSMVAIMTAWSLFAAPTPYTTQDHIPGLRPTQENRIETYRPGLMYHFATGRKPGIMEPPRAGDQILAHLGFLTDSANSGGLPDLVSGGGVGARFPSLTFQSAYEAATDRLRPAIKSLERVFTGILYRCFDLISSYGTPIRVNGWTYEHDMFGDRSSPAAAVIDPAEAARRRRMYVKIDTDATQDLIAKGTHGQYMVAAKLWDREMAMRFGGVRNVDETMAKIAADESWLASLPVLAQMQLMENPEIAQFMQMQQQQQQQAGGVSEGAKGLVVGPELIETPVGRNRAGTPAGRGGGARGIQTHEPRGNRSGYPGSTYGRS